MWKKFFNKKTLYIILFIILYCITAGISLTHAVAFFGLANNEVMSIMLATAFEVGQAAVLFSLLTSKKDRSKFLPWVLMFIFTVVQIMGNVFSSYKYLMVNSAESLKYFKEPIFIWMDLPDDQCNVILSYLLGGLLPVCSLALTSMVTNFVESEETEKIQEITEDKKVTKEVLKSAEPIEILTDSKKELEEKIKEVEEKEIPEKTGFINL